MDPFDDEYLGASTDSADSTDSPVDAAVLPSLPVSRGFMYIGDRQGNMATPPSGGSWIPAEADQNYARHEQLLQDEANRKAQEERDMQAQLAALGAADRIKATEMAIRQAGLRKYEQGVAAGMTPQEAYRLSAAEINFNHPSSMAAAMKTGSLTPEFQPRVVELPDGTKVLQTGPNRSSLIKVEKPKPPPDVVATEKNLSKQIDVLSKEAHSARAVLNKDVPIEQKTDAARRARIAEEQMAELQKQRLVNSTNWMGAPKPPASVAASISAPAAPAKASEPPSVTTKADYDALPSNTVYRGKDGRLYRKP